MSVAGGLHEAVLRGAAHRTTALQIFTRNNAQWAMKPLTPAVIADWKQALADHPMEVMVHDSYLINLGSPDEALWKKSRQNFLDEALRCVALGITSLVFHPGSHLGKGDTWCLGRIAKALDWVDTQLGDAPVKLLLENTAGQGTNVGWRFEHLSGILERVRRTERLGVCIDTCHLLAAGYDIRKDNGYRSVFEEFDRLIGTERILGFHLNDSKKELGSRVDRHEGIGKGFVGSRAFRLLMQDPRFANVPKVLETPKAGDMDKRNLALLRRLARMR